MELRFEWDALKEAINIEKHGVDFSAAERVFLDPSLRIFLDEKHDHSEPRMFAVGKVDQRIMTVRFVWRNGNIRIIGAGYWRKGKKYYEEKKN